MDKKNIDKRENLIFERIRESLGITQAEFARALETSRGHYWTRVRHGTKIDGAYLLKAFELSNLSSEELGRELIECLREERKLAAKQRKPARAK